MRELYVSIPARMDDGRRALCGEQFSCVHVLWAQPGTVLVDARDADHAPFGARDGEHRQLRRGHVAERLPAWTR
jgi:hypothetical protein